MTERPIIFSTEMAQAILTETKNQTRRTVLLPSYAPEVIGKQPGDWTIKGFKVFDGLGEEYGTLRMNKWGEVGDLLWVRESHKAYRIQGNTYRITYSDGSALDYYFKSLSLATLKKLIARKTLNKDVWTPGMFLPKDLARIWLQIIDLRVERLHDISQSDAIDEGIHKTWIHDDPQECKYKNYINDGTGSLMPCQSFRSLWKSINGEASWKLNPWVWVIKFKVISTLGKPKTIKQLAHVGQSI